jgi:hypothetical protein
MTKRVLTPFVVALLLVLTAIVPGYSTSSTPTAHAATKSHATCTGPTVTVYGSSALSSYISATAADFCNYEVSNTLTQYQVQYVSGGDSCPGDTFASTSTTSQNNLGVSDVFSGSCPAPVNSALISDNIVTVNTVLAVTNCPGAAAPQGGHPGIYGTGANAVTAANSCQGQNSGAPTTCPGSLTGTKTFYAPNSLSDGTANLYWNNQVTTLNQIGGCNATPANFRIQNRKTDSGTRITYCFNVFGGSDSCVETATCVDGSNQGGCTNGTTPDPSCGATVSAANATCPSGLAATTGIELDAVCGSRSNTNNGGNAYDPEGTIGYSSRAGLWTSSGVENPYPNCGIVNYNSVSPWNAQCDPYGLDQGASETGTVKNNDGVTICAGDSQVASDAYPIWGYEHFVTRAGSTAAGVAAYLAYISGTASPAPSFNPDFYNDQQGFIRECRENFSRATDGGAVSLGNISGGAC